MSAARKFEHAAIAESDPLWQKFLTSPYDPNPAPEQEIMGLEETKGAGFVDGATVSAEIARRAELEG